MLRILFRQFCGYSLQECHPNLWNFCRYPAIPCWENLLLQPCPQEIQCLNSCTTYLQLAGKLQDVMTRRTMLCNIFVQDGTWVGIEDKIRSYLLGEICSSVPNIACSREKHAAVADPRSEDHWRIGPEGPGYGLIAETKLRKARFTSFWGGIMQPNAKLPWNSSLVNDSPNNRVCEALRNRHIIWAQQSIRCMRQAFRHSLPNTNWIPAHGAFRCGFWVPL